MDLSQSIVGILVDLTSRPRVSITSVLLFYLSLGFRVWDVGFRV